MPLVVVVGEGEERAEGVGLRLERAVAAQPVHRRVDHLVRVRARVGHPITLTRQAVERRVITVPPKHE